MDRTPRVRRLRIPGLPPIAWALDPGDAKSFRPLLTTRWRAELRRQGRLVEVVDLGSGLVTIKFANDLVADAVTGTTVVPTPARYKYMDVGTGSTAATDGDTGLQTPITSGPARVVATLSNLQSATTGNHAAKLEWSAAYTFSGAYALTETGLFDSAGTGNPLTGGNMADHRVFSVITTQSGDQWTFKVDLTIPSNV